MSAGVENDRFFIALVVFHQAGWGKRKRAWAIVFAAECQAAAFPLRCSCSCPQREACPRFRSGPVAVRHARNRRLRLCLSRADACHHNAAAIRFKRWILTWNSFFGAEGLGRATSTLSCSARRGRVNRPESFGICDPNRLSVQKGECVLHALRVELSQVRVHRSRDEASGLRWARCAGVVRRQRLAVINIKRGYNAAA